MNKKGQTMIVMLMVAILIFIFAAVSTPTIITGVRTAGNTSANLNCTSTTNTSYVKATCSIMDMGLFYLIGAMIAIGMALLTGQKEISKILQVIFVFVVVVVLITPLKGIIVLFRDASHLNCAGSISIGSRMLCIFVDLWLFWFIAAALVAASTYFYAKRIQR